MPELTAELKEALGTITSTFAEHKGATQTQIDALKATIATLGITETKEGLTNLRTIIDQMRAEMLRPTPGTPGGGPEQKSLGQKFIELDAVKEFARSWRKGYVPMDLDGPFFERKTLIDSSALGYSTPGILSAERVGGITKPPVRRLRVRDLIPWGTTGSSAIEFLKENAFTNAASPQTEGQDKGESALTFTIDHAHVQTIATWIPASRQALDDLAQLQAYVETRLLDGLADIEDYELLSGDGTGVHLKGLAVHATAVVGTYATASDTYIDKVNNAITELEDAEYVADGLVLHPADWRKMQKVKTDDGGANTGLYILGGPAGNPGLRLWDLPVARTTAMPKGNFLVGQFQGSAQGFDRMMSRIDISTEHDDYFVKNKIAIRAEERIALAVFRPAAFRYGTF
jgi:HK97 family phage major capsid protein